MQVLVVGIDVAKDTLQVCFQLKGCDKPLAASQSLANAKSGWVQLVAGLNQALTQLACERAEVYLEATGVYAEKLCRHLAQVAQLSIHVVPADRLSHYLKALHRRGKTDDLDALGIARFGAHHDWPAWTPQSEAVAQLRHLLQTMEGVKQMRQQVRNRLHADEHRQVTHRAAVATEQVLLKTCEHQLRQLQKAVVATIRATPALHGQQQLLATIPGVGPETVLAVLALIGEELPASRKQLVAYVGLAPRPHESGASVHRRATTAPSQGRAIRKMLYMGVLQAFKRNPELKRFYERLTAKGKPPKLALTACMRKQLHIIWGVLKNQQAFDPARMLPDTLQAA